MFLLAFRVLPASFMTKSLDNSINHIFTIMRKFTVIGGILIAVVISYFSGAALFADYAQFGLSTLAISKTLAPLESTSTRITISLDTTTPCDSSIPTCFNYNPVNDLMQYDITRMPHCDAADGDGNCTSYALDLCRYLAADTESGEFANALTRNPLDTSLSLGAFGALSSPGDLSDNWDISMVSPCFDGECPAGYDNTVYGDPLPITEKGKTFKCDLHVDYHQNIFLVLNNLAPNIAYAQVAPNVIELSAVFTGNTAPVQPACAPNCHSSVLFLPGLEASRLYRPWVCNQNNCEIRLWEPPADSLVNQLFLDQNGSSTLPDVYTRDILGQVFETGPRVYQSFIEQMNQMATSGVIAEWEAIPYDWRFSADTILDGGKKYPDGSISYIDATSSPYILQELKRLAKNSQTGKVTIIAHSNGGLIAKRLLQRLGDTEASNLVDKLVLVASPQTGTPQAIGALLHGYKQELPGEYFSAFLKDSTARVLGENMPGGYQLLPSDAYFSGTGSHVTDPVVEFEKNKSQTAIFRNSYGTEITSVGSMDAFLLGFDGRQKPDVNNVTYPNILHANLLAQANALHGAIDTWTPTSTIKITQIAGWGVDTLRTIHYVQGGFFHCLGVSPCIDYDPLVTEDGDGTVVFPSALAISTSTSNVSRYWLDLMTYNDNNPDVEHANILEVKELRDFIANIITNNQSSLPVFVSSLKPLEHNAQKRLRYFLHSPLTLNLYDDMGHHVGVSTTTGLVENQIRGAHYGEFGEVKYISAPASTTLHLLMNGQANGGFSLKIEEAQGNTVVATTTFQDIPSSTSTVATFDTPVGGGIASSSALRVDENGDGIIDYNLTPKIGDIVTIPVVTPDTTAPTTTASTTGILGNNGWYTNNVLVTLTATDTESGVASTTYSLNGGATWNTYAVPLTISQEGSTTVLYRSTDKAGNSETIHTLSIRLDKTAPEANISVSTSTQDILVTGVDNLGTTTISKDASNMYIVTDQAGHATKLFFTKTYNGKQLTYAKLTGLQYDNTAKIILPTSSFLYVWDTKAPIVPMSQTIAVNDAYVIQALYSKQTNKTTVLVLKRNLPIQTQIFTGLEIVKLTTSKGVVGYSL